MSAPRKSAVIFFALLTAVQAGTGLWRIGIMFQEAQKHGARPLVLGTGMFEEVALSGFLAFIAWWWLPRNGRSWARWAVHFLIFAWAIALIQMCWAMAVGFLERGIIWAILAVLLLLGTWARSRPEAISSRPALPPFRITHPALIASLIFWLLQAPHLFFTYHWMDAKQIWACRAVAFEARGDLTGMFDCLDPSRPPLYSVLLWLGHNDPTMEGRLLPFLMVGAFGVVVFYLLRHLAPRLAPWGVLWFFMTVRVYQGAITSYADVPVMMAITIGIVLAVERDLVSSAWRAVIFAIVAGAVATLIKRDGAVMIAVGSVVLLWFSNRRWSPRLYGALAGAALGVALWLFRPALLYEPDQYSLEVETASIAPAPTEPMLLSISQGQKKHVIKHKRVWVSDTLPVTAKTFVTMAYGMQGQVLSHYGYSMFVPAWIILAIWVWRARIRLPPEARRWGWVGVLGWLAIVGIYVANVLTGHAERATLYVIRTGFGRHLVHMFVFCLLHATALAAALIYGPAADSSESS